MKLYRTDIIQRVNKKNKTSGLRKLFRLTVKIIVKIRQYKTEISRPRQLKLLENNTEGRTNYRRVSQTQLDVKLAKMSRGISTDVKNIQHLSCLLSMRHATNKTCREITEACDGRIYSETVTRTSLRFAPFFGNA